MAIARYALGGDALRDGLAAAPFASVNYGAGGIAYAIYSIAQRRNDRVGGASERVAGEEDEPFAVADRESDDAGGGEDLPLDRAGGSSAARERAERV